MALSRISPTIRQIGRWLERTPKNPPLDRVTTFLPGPALPFMFSAAWLPSLERWRRRFAPISIRVVDPASLVEQWNLLRLKPGETWVDIGSGNGATLSRIAKRDPEGRIVGIELANSAPLKKEEQEGWRHLSELPPNVRFLVLGTPEFPYGEGLPIRYPRYRSLPKRIHLSTLDAVGRGQASVVSLLFPYNEPSREDPDPLRYLLLTAIHLLKEGGGTGFMVTESLAALHRTIDFLKGRFFRVSSAVYSTEPLSEKTLRSMEIEPYTVLSIKGRGRFEPFVTFRQAYSLLFTVK
jgi:hypothetical protein